MEFTKKIRTWFGAQDMTVGKPMECLIRFSVPLLIGNLAQQLYNTVDSMIVGKYVGDVALAAVGTAGPILNLMLVLFMGVATGASILTAQLFGAHDREKLTREVGTTVTLTILSGLLMTVVGMVAAPKMIGLLNLQDQPEVAAGAEIYLSILFAGMVGASLYNIISGVLRGMGDSVYPLIFLIVASLLNIALDLLLVRSMGIAGVAWATIIAQGISGVLCLIRLWRMKEVDLNVKQLKPDMKIAGQLGLLGLPAGITQVIFSLSSILVQGWINLMGEAVIAANVAVMRVDGFAMMPNFTFGTAATTYVGQNVGAGRQDRIDRGLRDLLIIALSFAAAIVLCILLFGTNLIALFSGTQEVVDLGRMGLRWLAFGYVCFAVTQVLHGVMRGYGETALPMWISLITTIVLRMPLCWLLISMTRTEALPGGEPQMIFASLLVAWVLGMVITAVLYRYGSWRKKKMNLTAPGKGMN